MEKKKENIENKNLIVAAILAFTLGPLGAHKFYLGKKKTGLLFLSVTLFPFLLAFIDWSRLVFYASFSSDLVETLAKTSYWLLKRLYLLPILMVIISWIEGAIYLMALRKKGERLFRSENKAITGLLVVALSVVVFLLIIAIVIMFMEGNVVITAMALTLFFLALAALPSIFYFIIKNVFIAYILILISFLGLLFAFALFLE